MAHEEGLSVKSPLVSAKLTRKFYEPVALLVCLNGIFKEKTSRRTAEILCDSNLELEEIFHSFVCKLGQLCDSRPRGRTVTSFSILQKPEGIEYVFASNKRSVIELETTRAYVAAILKCLGEAQLEDDEKQAELHTRLLEDILLFNLPRIKRYLSCLVRELDSCINICTSEETPDAKRLHDKLQHALHATAAACGEGLDDGEFLDRTQRAIAAIYTVKQSTTNILIQKRASDEAANNTKPWREVRHIFGRLLSYGQTVEVLLISRYIWPQLFRDFEVNYVVSSRSHTNPLFASPLSAEIIVGRMSLGEEKDKYLQQAQALPQKAQLDEAVEKQWTDPNFRPYVHAEILLLNWLENTGGTRPPRFFNNWPYIGASKPTCRLCDYYFKCHPNGVESRGSHGNLYPNWRFPDDPDVEEESGDIAVRTRQGLMQAITGHLRNEILRVLKEGVPFTRTHDSNTYSMFGLEQVPDILAGTSHSPRTEGSSGLGSISGDTAPSPDWTGVDAGAEQDSSSG